MKTDTLGTRGHTGPPVPDAVFDHRALESPYGYVLGVALWSVYLAAWYGAVYAAETLALIPFAVSVVVFVVGLLVTSAVSAAVICVTAWHVPTARLRAHLLWVAPFVFVAPLLFLVYFRPVPGMPSLAAAMAPLGLDVFLDHALLTTGLLGPTLGCAFLAFALLTLAYRYRRERA